MTGRRYLLAVLLALPLVAAVLFVAGRGQIAAPASAAVARKPDDNSGMLNWKKVAAGTHRTIFQNKQFKVTGTCVDNGGGNFTAEAFFSTKQDHASYFDTGAGTSDLDFNRSDGPVGFNLYPAGGTSADFQAYDYYDEMYAESAGGQVLIARIASGVHVFGGDCTFSGLFQDGKTATPPLDRKSVAAGTSATLFDGKEFKVVGDCVDNGGGNYSAQAFLITKQDNAMWQYASSPATGDLDFDTADAPVPFPYPATGTGSQFVAWDYYDEIVAIGADGKMLIARVATGVHRSVDCTFSGLFTDSRNDFTRDMSLVPAGTTKVLWDDSQFQVLGTCIDNGGGDFTAQAYLVTKNDGAMYFVSNVGAPVFGFDSFDPPAAFDGYPASGTSPELIAWDYYSEVYATAASGRALIARVITSVHVLGGDCGFAGRFQD